MVAIVIFDIAIQKFIITDVERKKDNKKYNVLDDASLFISVSTFTYVFVGFVTEEV